MSFAKSSDTVGGLSKLWILPLQQFSGMEYHPASGQWRMKDALSSLDPFYFTPDTGGYKVEWKKGAYHITLTAKVPGNSVALDVALLRLELSPFLLVGLNHNGQYLLFGDAQNYFIYERNQDSGSDFADLSHYAFELTRQMMIRPRFLLDPFMVFPPLASNVVILGILNPNAYATMAYSYKDDLGLSESGSIHKWYLADDVNGSNRQLINGANGMSYFMKDSDGLKYLQASVTPSNGKLMGPEVVSSYYLVQELLDGIPVASNVVLTGNNNPGSHLKATYDYSHEDGTPEQGTLFKFYLASDAQGNGKQLQVSSTINDYTVKVSDAGKYVCVGVVPNDGKQFGNEVLSVYRVITVDKPFVTDVGISGNVTIDEIVFPLYTYHDPYGLPEYTSYLKWYVADDATGTNKTELAQGVFYKIVESIAGKYLQLGVTPSNGIEIGDEEFSDYSLIGDNKVYYPATQGFWLSGTSIVELTNISNDRFKVDVVGANGMFHGFRFSFIGPLDPSFTIIYLEFEYYVSGGSLPTMKIYSADWGGSMPVNGRSSGSDVTYDPAPALNTWNKLSMYSRTTVDPGNSFFVDVDFPIAYENGDTFEFRNVKAWTMG